MRGSRKKNNRVPSLESCHDELSETIQKNFIVRIEPSFVAAGALFFLLQRYAILTASVILWRAFIRRLGEGMKRKSNPDKSFAVENSFHSHR